MRILIQVNCFWHSLLTYPPLPLILLSHSENYNTNMTINKHVSWEYCTLSIIFTSWHWWTGKYLHYVFLVHALSTEIFYHFTSAFHSAYNFYHVLNHIWQEWPARKASGATLLVTSLGKRHVSIHQVKCVSNSAQWLRECSQ
jgi:hypothetical protein